MLTRSQQILLKRAQAEAGIADAEYRASLAQVTGLEGCRSSTDRRLSDAHLDSLLAYYEAIYWRGVEAGRIADRPRRDPVFRTPGYWSGKNARGNTSRDRFTAGNLAEQIATAEAEIRSLGASDIYLQRIGEKTGPGRPYLAALQRTLPGFRADRQRAEARREKVWGVDKVRNEKSEKDGP